MVNVESTPDSELDLQVTPDSESLETSQTSQGAEGENEDSKLNLETDEPKADKLSSAEENAQRQVDHWLLEVTSGRKKLEDAPGWVQKRMTPHLDGTTTDTAEIVRKELERQQEDAEFKSLQASIPQLTAAQAQELQERYKTLRPAGKVAALKASLEAMGLNSKLKEAEQRGIAKGKVSLPRSGQPAVKKSEPTVDGVPVSVIQNNKAWRDLLASQQ